jgi:hypothetical protein
MLGIHLWHQGEMSKPADLAVTGLRLRNVLTDVCTCQAAPQAAPGPHGVAGAPTRVRARPLRGGRAFLFGN